MAVTIGRGKGMKVRRIDPFAAVDKALSSFHKAQDALELAGNQLESMADEQVLRSRELQAEANETREESERAFRVLANIRAITES